MTPLYHYHNNTGNEPCECLLGNPLRAENDKRLNPWHTEIFNSYDYTTSTQIIKKDKSPKWRARSK